MPDDDVTNECDCCGFSPVATEEYKLDPPKTGTTRLCVLCACTHAPSLKRHDFEAFKATQATIYCTHVLLNAVQQLRADLLNKAKGDKA